MIDEQTLEEIKNLAKKGDKDAVKKAFATYYRNNPPTDEELKSVAGGCSSESECCNNILQAVTLSGQCLTGAIIENECCIVWAQFPTVGQCLASVCGGT